VRIPDNTIFPSFTLPKHSHNIILVSLNPGVHPRMPVKPNIIPSSKVIPIKKDFWFYLLFTLERDLSRCIPHSVEAFIIQKHLLPLSFYRESPVAIITSLPFSKNNINNVTEVITKSNIDEVISKILNYRSNNWR
jgi:hypothetical protein